MMTQAQETEQLHRPPIRKTASSSTNIPSRLCAQCQTNRALIIRPKNHQRLCKPCFLHTFETEIHHTITSSNLFPSRGERIAIGASGGKDSTVLAAVLKTLNERYDYGVEFVLLSIDEGIKGYRDDSLETVKRNAKQYGMELVIVGYDELYGWTMDQVVGQVGKKGNCTYCGVFRRQALDRGASRLDIRHVVTGHNADDVAETVIMNLLRGDLPRLGRCTHILTSSSASLTRRSKPLKYAYEKEIVLYAHHRQLDYFSTECIYSPEAFRGSARTLIKDLEKSRPSAILDIVRSGEELGKLVPGASSSGEGIINSNGNTKTKTTTTETQVDEDEGKVFISCGSTSAGLGTLIDTADDEIDVEDELAPIKSNSDSNTPSTSTTTTQHAHRISTPATTEIPSPLPSQPSTPTPEATIPTPRNKRGGNRSSQPKRQVFGSCQRCGYLSSQSICKACVLLEGLNKARPSMEVSLDHDYGQNGVKNSKVTQRMEALKLGGVEI